MPFPPSAEVEKFQRDDDLFGQTRQAALTFGLKPGQAPVRTSFVSGGEWVPYDDPKNDYDSNGTLQ